MRQFMRIFACTAVTVTEYASWLLCTVLWSDMHYSSASTYGGDDNEWPHRRRRAFNEWLADVCEPQLNDDLVRIDKMVCYGWHCLRILQPSATARESSTILRLLQSGRMKQAASYALERAHRPRTAAAIMSLIADGGQCKQLMNAQLKVWNMVGLRNVFSSNIVVCRRVRVLK